MQHFTIHEVANQLKVSESTVYGLIGRKQLGHVRIGGRRGAIRISESHLHAFLGVADVQPIDANSSHPIRKKKDKTSCHPARCR